MSNKKLFGFINFGFYLHIIHHNLLFFNLELHCSYSTYFFKGIIFMLTLLDKGVVIRFINLII